MKPKEHKKYYENGQLKAHRFSLNGKLNGEYKRYYENGQLRQHCFYLNGKCHGEYKPYHNGQLETHYFFLNHKKINIPFLKTKPSRLPYKSTRSRFQTLEIQLMST